ncbi:hypothetical protein TPY_1679 [Sulfobacillus acidophilus TPY]|jgi:hypothetical protein|uniref:YlzJ-like protein n=1 Tax=Sulfobacillus acidophilus (strain ATCC 700253 / DSM 10332 / NAL) TaxID=679936 RepID=G8U0R9_SULAD|nr:hypothetical protein TPY_1679 [Sulfobacillus acidophilus TPY]AEW05372.1 hypothetical protein Sulac_1879 [Sulfobacillus acidophilus DSM 10332]MCY0865193.1 YlzJ-like family protein [Sulfobacillus sp.]
MILYTPLAWDDIFPAPEDAAPVWERIIDGRLCLVRQSPDGTPRLERLLSTDPADYLNPAFQPNRLLF